MERLVALVCCQNFGLVPQDFLLGELQDQREELLPVSYYLKSNPKAQAQKEEVMLEIIFF
jgi:hypothetical protein